MDSLGTPCSQFGFTRRTARYQSAAAFALQAPPFTGGLKVALLATNCADVAHGLKKIEKEKKSQCLYAAKV